MKLLPIRCKYFTYSYIHSFAYRTCILIIRFYFREDAKDNLLESIAQMNILTTMFQQTAHETARTTDIMRGVVDALEAKNMLF